MNDTGDISDSSGNPRTGAGAPPPQVVRLTPRAIQRVRALMARGGDGVLGLRIGVTTKGCSGMSYDVAYATDKRSFEEEIDCDGARIFIDPAAVMFLIGSEIDYREGKLESGFVFANPNETARCGCGESFSIA